MIHCGLYRLLQTDLKLLRLAQGYLIGRLRHGLKKIWNERLGLVHRIGHPRRYMLAYYSVAAGGRSYLCSLYDFVCIPYYRILPYHAVLRAKESAQTEFSERIIRRRLH